jgi:hypothetical protein
MYTIVLICGGDVFPCHAFEIMHQVFSIHFPLLWLLFFSKQPLQNCLLGGNKLQTIQIFSPCPPFGL